MTAETLTRKPETINTIEDTKLVETIKKQLSLSAEEADRVIINYAFGKLYNKYSNSIAFRYRNILNDEENLKDLVSSTFKKAYESICSYDDSRSAFSTWLYTISKHLYIDLIRNKKNSTTTVISQVIVRTEDDLSIPYEIKDIHAKTGQQIYEKKERAKLVNRVIDSCFAKKPFLKELIRMRFFEEKSYQEIVQATNKPLGTIKVDLMEAKDKLKVALEAEGLEYF